VEAKHTVLIYLKVTVICGTVQGITPTGKNLFVYIEIVGDSSPT